METSDGCKRVAVERLDDYQGQAAVRITTPAATYVYHLEGAGFASILTPDGADWISFRPAGGSAGHYRGIPNLIYPEGGFHPGAQLASRTTVSRDGEGRVVLASATEDSAWQAEWVIDEARATCTVLAAAHPYWFLYEGTPGGALNTGTGCLLMPRGQRLCLAARWEAAMGPPAWIAFADSGSDYLLYLLHHEADAHLDSYRPMNGEMTVFGFGRSLTKLGGEMSRVPNRFTVGLLDVSGVPALQRHTLLAAVVEQVLSAG